MVFISSFFILICPNNVQNHALSKHTGCHAPHSYPISFQSSSATTTSTNSPPSRWFSAHSQQTKASILPYKYLQTQSKGDRKKALEPKLHTATTKRKKENNHFHIQFSYAAKPNHNHNSEPINHNGFHSKPPLNITKSHWPITSKTGRIKDNRRTDA